MTDKSIWVVREIEKYDDDDVFPETLENSKDILVKVIGTENVIAEKVIDVPFPVETGHPVIQGHAFHITAYGLVRLMKGVVLGFNVLRDK